MVTAVYELTTEMFPAFIVAVVGAVTYPRLEERIWTVIARCAIAGFPKRSTSAMTRRPVHEFAGATHWTILSGCAKSFKAKGGCALTVTVSVPEAKPEEEAVMDAEPGTRPVV